jgi:adenylate cyclase
VFGLVLIALMFAVDFRFFHAFERMDLIAYDLRINSIAPRPASGVVAIAAIDDKSIAQIGQWPWPRAVEARLVDALRDYKVKVIGFDAIFSEPDDNDVSRAAIGKRLSGLGVKAKTIAEILGPSNDDAFAAAMKTQGETILGYAFASHNFRSTRGAATSTGFVAKIRHPGPGVYSIVRQAPGTPHRLIEADEYQPPFATLNDAAHSIGYFDVDADADGEFRTQMAVVSFDGKYCVPMFLAIADAYAGDAAMILGIGPNGVTAVSVAGVRIQVDD